MIMKKVYGLQKKINMNQITQKIKELYKTKASFCKANNHKHKDFASKLRTVKTKIDWLNVFLKPLKLKIKIVERET